MPSITGRNFADFSRWPMPNPPMIEPTESAPITSPAVTFGRIATAPTSTPLKPPIRKKPVRAFARTIGFFSTVNMLLFGRGSFRLFTASLAMNQRVPLDMPTAINVIADQVPSPAARLVAKIGPSTQMISCRFASKAKRVVSPEPETLLGYAVRAVV